jgi:hypothetical protein
MPMKKRNQKWNPTLIRATQCLISQERYNAQIKDLGRLLYDFYAKKKPTEAIQFETLQPKPVRPKRKAA